MQELKNTAMLQTPYERLLSSIEPHWDVTKNSYEGGLCETGTANLKTPERWQGMSTKVS